MWDTIFKIFVSCIQVTIIMAYVYKAFDYLCNEMGWHNPLS